MEMIFIVLYLNDKGILFYRKSFLLIVSQSAQEMSHGFRFQTPKDEAFLATLNSL